MAERKSADAGTKRAVHGAECASFYQARAPLFPGGGGDMGRTNVRAGSSTGERKCSFRVENVGYLIRSTSV